MSEGFYIARPSHVESVHHYSVSFFLFKYPGKNHMGLEILANRSACVSENLCKVMSHGCPRMDRRALFAYVIGIATSLFLFLWMGTVSPGGKRRIVLSFDRMAWHLDLSGMSYTGSVSFLGLILQSRSAWVIGRWAASDGIRNIQA